MLLAGALSACGDDAGVGPNGDVVGGPCTADDDCADGSACITEGDFPGGMCTIDECESNEDCPAGSVCISNEGGICMMTCSSSDDCRDGYRCDGKSLEEGEGDVDVCSG
jgi:hypothetical protein